MQKSSKCQELQIVDLSGDCQADKQQNKRNAGQCYPQLPEDTPVSSVSKSYVTLFSSYWFLKIFRKLTLTMSLRLLRLKVIQDFFVDTSMVWILELSHSQDFYKIDLRPWGQTHWDLNSSKIFSSCTDSINLKLPCQLTLEISHSQTSVSTHLRRALSLLSSYKEMHLNWIESLVILLSCAFMSVCIKLRAGVAFLKNKTKNIVTKITKCWFFFYW